jgi:nucleotide-binding universal stress UspA family protein
MTRMKNFADQHGLSPCTLNTRDDFREPHGIIQFAHDVKADLIAMGTHGRRGLAHFFSGSVTERVVNHMDGLIWTFSTHKSPGSGVDA